VEISQILCKAKQLFAGDGKVKLIVAAGLLGMLLILLSQFSASNASREKKEGIPQDTLTAEYTTDQYAQQLEDKLQALIGSIEGVGRTRVMVTLENGVEYVYAREEKSSVDKKRERGEGGKEGRVDYQEDTQYTYVFVDAGYGEKQPLLSTQRPPKVQGVVVVCQGADDIVVEESVINVVTTALNISTTRVCVVKIDATDTK